MPPSSGLDEDAPLHYKACLPYSITKLYGGLDEASRLRINAAPNG